MHMLINFIDSIVFLFQGQNDLMISSIQNALYYSKSVNKHVNKQTNE